MPYATKNDFLAYTVIRHWLYEEFEFEAIWAGDQGINIYMDGQKVDFIACEDIQDETSFMIFVKEYVAKLYAIPYGNGDNQDLAS